jgi:hypothetical protein
MRKKLSISAAIVLCAINLVFSQAQNVNIYWGKINTEDRFSRTTLLCKRGNFILGLKAGRGQISILKYSFNDLQVESENPIWGKESKTGGKVISNDYTYRSMITLKDKMYISVTKYERKTKENTLYLQEVDDNGRLTGQLKKMESIDAKSRYNRGDFDIFPSTDSTKVVIIDYPPYDKYAGEKFGFKTYDESLNPIADIKVEMPYKDRYFDADDFTFASDGMIYFMCKIYLDKKEKQKGEARYYYELVSVNPSGTGTVTEYEMKLPQKSISGISYSLEEDKFIVCAGFYGNIKGNSTVADEINGIFFLRIDKNSKQVVATGTKDLDKDFIADITSKRKADKGHGISNDFKIRDFIRRSDGGSIIMAEFAYDYVVTYTTTDSHGGVTTHTDYHYVRNNIIAININPDGSIKWYANIPKYQHTVNDGGAYISYFMVTQGDKMYMVYNDNPTNMDPTKVKTPQDMKTMSNSKGSTAVLVELSESGEFTKTPLFSNKDNKVTLMPASSLDIGHGQVIDPAFNPGFWCCVSFSAATSKLARFEFQQ